MLFRAVINLSSQEAIPFNPVAEATAWSIPSHLTSKEQYRAWCVDPNTVHRFVSCWEGDNPDLRVTRHNPAQKLLGFIADYDAPVDEATIKGVHERCASGGSPPPTYWAWSFTKGNARLIWEFEAPLFLPETRGARTGLIKAVRESLRAEHLLPGYDSSSTKQEQLFCMTPWTPFQAPGKGVVGTNVVESIAYAAAKKNLSQGDGPAVPIEAVAREIEARWPGRWPGEFRTGARGPLFWVEPFEPREGCIVGDKGIVCFSTRAGTDFVSWRALLGAAFTKKWADDRIGAATKSFFYDGRTYYELISGRPRDCGREQVVLALETDHGLSSAKDKETGEPSEIKRALRYIETAHRVDGAKPILFVEDRIVRENGKTWLNTASVRPIEASVKSGAWGEGFPWLANLLSSRFSEESLPYLLAWWKRFYGSAVRGRLEKGHVLVICGKPGCGKTLLASRIIGQSVGGSVDAAKFLAEGASFNDHLFESALWLVDDATIAVGEGSHRRYTEALKKVVAGAVFDVSAKFRKGSSTEWNGRVIVCTNTDPQSLDLVPDLDLSNSDKTMVFHMKGDNSLFHNETDASIRKKISAELPCLLAWLLDWEVPNTVVGSPRFGVREHYDKGLLELATRTGRTGQLLDIVNAYRLASGDHEAIEGTTAEIQLRLSACEAIRPLLSGFRMSVIRNLLVRAASSEFGGVKVVSNDRGQPIFRIEAAPGKDATSPLKFSSSP